MDTILLISSDKILRFALKNSLEETGFLVLETPHVQWLPDILKAQSLDLILLDLHLPEGTDLTHVTRIRELSDVPLLLLCDKGDRSRKSEGFDKGADGIVDKPIKLDEFLANVKASIRRDGRGGRDARRMNGKKLGTRPLIFDKWTVDPTQSQIFDKANLSGSLTIQEFRLLRTLIENAGTVLKRSDLCEAMQEGNYVPQPRAIDIKIARIRKKIGDNGDNPKIIRTVRGVGYTIDDKLIDDKLIDDELMAG